MCETHTTNSSDGGGGGEEALQLLLSLGFGRDAAAAALAQTSNDVERAAALLVDAGGDADGGGGEVDDDEELAKSLYLSELQHHQKRLQEQVNQKEREIQEKQQREASGYGSPFDFSAVSDPGASVADPSAAAAGSRAGSRRGGEYFSNLLYIVTLYRKYSRALTFQNM